MLFGRQTSLHNVTGFWQTYRLHTEANYTKLETKLVKQPDMGYIELLEYFWLALCVLDILIISLVCRL